MSLFSSQGGFTLVEMLTILTIIGLLTALVFVNTQVGSQRQELRDAAAGYVVAARNAESLASSSQAVPDPDQADQPVSRKAYGVCITSSEIPDSQCDDPASAGKVADMYQVYARDPDETVPHPEESIADPPDGPDIINSFKLPKGVRFWNPDVWLDYLPPAPTMYANGDRVDTQLILLHEDTTLANCLKRRDCQFVQVKPRAGAVYVE